MVIPAPKIGPFEINLNTIVVLVGFAGGLVAWGWTLAEMQSGRSINAWSAATTPGRSNASRDLWQAWSFVTPSAS